MPVEDAIVDWTPKENDANGLGLAASDDIGVSDFFVSGVNFVPGDENGVDEAGFVRFPKIDFCSWLVGTVAVVVTVFPATFIVVGVFGDCVIFLSCNAAVIVGFANAAPNVGAAGLFLMCCGGIVTLKFGIA